MPVRNLSGGHKMFIRESSHKVKISAHLLTHTRTHTPVIWSVICVLRGFTDFILYVFSFSRCRVCGRNDRDQAEGTGEFLGLVHCLACVCVSVCVCQFILHVCSDSLETGSSLSNSPTERDMEMELTSIDFYHQVTAGFRSSWLQILHSQLIDCSLWSSQICLFGGEVAFPLRSAWKSANSTLVSFLLHRWMTCVRRHSTSWRTPWPLSLTWRWKLRTMIWGKSERFVEGLA